MSVKGLVRKQDGKSRIASKKIGPPVPGISPCPGENRACDASIVCKTLQHTKRDSFGVPEITLENDVCIIVRLGSKCLQNLSQTSILRKTDRY